MNRITVTCVLFIAVSSAGNAALIDRGNGLIYDNVLGITWLYDANYAATSGYASANANGDIDSFPGNIQESGRMGWQAALDWVAQLDFAGHSEWRLPKIDPDCPVENANLGHDVLVCDSTETEMGYMFYENLGVRPGRGIMDAAMLNDPNFNHEAYSLFENLTLDTSHWSSTEYTYSANPELALSFYNNDGGVHISDKYFSRYAWAVHDGDIGLAVAPLPGSVWFGISAFFGLALVKNYRKFSAKAC